MVHLKHHNLLQSVLLCRRLVWSQVQGEQMGRCENILFQGYMSHLSSSDRPFFAATYELWQASGSCWSSDSVTFSALVSFDSTISEMAVISFLFSLCLLLSLHSKCHTLVAVFLVYTPGVPVPKVAHLHFLALWIIKYTAHYSHHIVNCNKP